MKNSADFIVSLVGLNPLPNYISILNYCDHNTEIYLVYSGKDEVTSSSNVADNIENTVYGRFPGAIIKKKESSKSNFVKIIKTIKTITEEIDKKVKEASLKGEKVNILLDITGSTKPISALAYSKMQEKYEFNENVNFCSSYVSNELNRIFQKGFRNIEYKLSDLSEDKRVSKEEILKLHGYDEYINKKNNFNLIDRIYLKDLTLIFYVESKILKLKEIKEDMFMVLDVAEKLGGSLSKIYYKAASFINKGKKQHNEEDAQKDFLKVFENGTNISYKDRIILKSSDGTCNNEEIDFFIEGVE